MKPIETMTAKEYRAMKLPKKSKYNNKLIKFNGLKFGSQGEFERYQELRIAEIWGLIKDLRCQVRFELLPSVPAHDGLPAQRAMYYIADYTYLEKRLADLKTGEVVPGGYWAETVEDFKGRRTQVYLLKKKLMRAKGYIVRETGGKR